MEPVLRVALVGHGRWGRRLAASLASLPQVEVCGICDLNLTPGERVPGQSQGCRAFHSFDALLTEERPQAVLVATPSALHAEMARRALTTGAHVFVEKPMALAVSAARTLCELAQSERKVLMVGHVLHHEPAVRRAFEILRHGEIGSVRLFVSERLNLGSRVARAAWWDLGPHDVSLALRAFAAEPRSVELELRGKRAVATLKFAPGQARLSVGQSDQRVRRMAWLADDAALVLQEQSGTLVLSRVALTRGLTCELLAAPEREIWQTLNEMGSEDKRVAVPADDALRLQLTHFVHCVQSGQSPLCDGREGLAVVRALAQGERSLHERVAPVATLPSSLELWAAEPSL